MSQLPRQTDIAESRVPWAFVFNALEREVDERALRVGTSSSVTARIIRGQRCRTSQSLFSEWAAALQFPYYFGHNWDAFDECLSDLQWLQARHCIIFVTNFDQLLEKSEKDFKTFIEILRDDAEEKARAASDSELSIRPPPLLCVFHCTAGAKSKVMHRLVGARIVASTDDVTAVFSR